MHSIVLSDIQSDDQKRLARISLIDSSYFCIDYYEDDRYCYSNAYPDKTIQYVENVAEDYVRENKCQLNKSSYPIYS